MAQINLLTPLRPGPLGRIPRRAGLRLAALLLLAVAAAAAVGWYHATLIARLTTLEGEVRQTREHVAALRPQAERRAALAEELRRLSQQRGVALAASRRGASLATLTEVAPRGVTVDAVATADGRLEVAARAPSLDALATYFAALAAAPALRDPRLTSVARDEAGLAVRFSVGMKDGP